MEEKTANGRAQGADMGRIGHRPYSVLYLSIGIRAAHQVGAAVFLAAYLLASPSRPPMMFVLIATFSGVLLYAAEWMRHRQNYRELSGTVSLAKVALLGAAFHGFLPAGATVLLVFVAASLIAHAPKRVRHRLLWKNFFLDKL